MSHPEYTEENDPDWDWGYEAQVVAQEHLNKCMEAMFEEQDAADPDGPEPQGSPASAPFDGCDTCVVREVLHAALPVIERGLKPLHTAPPWIPKPGEIGAFEAGLIRALKPKEIDP